MHRPLLMSAAAVVAFTASHALAQPVINFPPPGSHSFVGLYETDAPLSTCLHVQCEIVSSPSVSSTMAPVTFTGSSPLNFVSGSGSTGPDAMHAFITASNFGEVDTAFTDTYTVHGGTAPFQITVTMNVDSIASTIPFGPGNIAITSLTGMIGTFAIDPATTLIPTVVPFDVASQKQVSHNFTGRVADSAPLDLSVSYSRIVNPGDVFDIAYELEADALGVIDASHTATIGFTLPDGVFLTAASGATFGATPPPFTGVPEPASWALMIGGFGGIGAALRTRRRLARAV
jgi:hypothetical protein